MADVPLGSLYSGSRGSRGRGRGRGGARGGASRKFTPTVAPRKKQDGPSDGAPSTLPKIMQAPKRVKIKKERPKFVRADPLANSKVAFVASSTKKTYTSIARGISGTAVVSSSIMPSPSPSPTMDDFESDREDNDGVETSHSSYVPTLLPYAPSTSPDNSSDARPQLHTTAAELFTHCHQTASSDENSLGMWQLPVALPFAAQSKAQVKHSEDNELITSLSEKKVSNVNDDEHSPMIERLPSGYFGQLKVHRSGKCVLHCAGLTLDVELGSSYPFEQELVSIDSNTASMHRLGTLNHRIVCSLNIENLLARST